MREIECISPVSPKRASVLSSILSLANSDRSECDRGSILAGLKDAANILTSPDQKNEEGAYGSEKYNPSDCHAFEAE